MGPHPQSSLYARLNCNPWFSHWLKLGEYYFGFPFNIYLVPFSLCWAKPSQTVLSWPGYTSMIVAETMLKRTMWKENIWASPVLFGMIVCKGYKWIILVPPIKCDDFGIVSHMLFSSKCFIKTRPEQIKTLSYFPLLVHCSQRELTHFCANSLWWQNEQRHWGLSQCLLLLLYI